MTLKAMLCAQLTYCIVGDTATMRYTHFQRISAQISVIICVANGHCGIIDVLVHEIKGIDELQLLVPMSVFV